MEIETKKLNLIILKNAFVDNYGLAMDINDVSVRYFLISPTDFTMCIIGLYKYKPEYTNEQHIEAVKNTIGMEKIETYMKKLRNLTNFAINNLPF